MLKNTPIRLNTLVMPDGLTEQSTHQHSHLIFARAKSIKRKKPLNYTHGKMIMVIKPLFIISPNGQFIFKNKLQ